MEEIMDKKQLKNFQNFCDDISLTEINTIIEEIETNRDSLSPLTLVKKIDRIIRILFIDSNFTLKNQRLFRIRQDLNDEKLINQGLLFPRDKSLCRQGRFNFHGQCKGYFSDSPFTANKESASGENERLHILECLVLENNLRIGYVPIIDDRLENISSNKQNSISRTKVFDALKLLGDKNELKAKTVLSFIGKEMVRVADNYLIPNIIGHLLFTAFEINVLIYPSIKTNLEGNNLVWDIDAVDKYIQPIRAQGQFHNQIGIFDMITYKKK